MMIHPSINISASAKQLVICESKADLFLATTSLFPHMYAKTLGPSYR
jgi:hypothetical protein